MKKNTHPDTQIIKAVCSTCKTNYDILTTIDNIRIEICSNCHPFYTGKQTIIDTANKVKDFERRKSAATNNSSKITKKRKEKITEIKGEKLITLRDMLKSLQN